ncbi:MAG: 1-acyl-sn-glycerol-3-phosphate acyltransferase [Leptolyngbyaceae bacterium]|nr:1-acyl-sn-glycerol-3-phosphate acyltransferase [Leptolyngbyaceae bacterium]
MRYAKPRLEFIPPRFNPWVLQVAQWSLPILLRFRTRPWLPAGISQVETENAEVLVDLYEQFQAGNIRLILAFRHPEVNDPLCMLHLLSRAVPQTARQQGIRLQFPIHSHFIYDRGMTLWAGDWLGWLFSRLGGTPIHRGKRLDRKGMKMARSLLVQGQFPMAVAPEGATNGLSDIVSPLEPGLAQLGFWCVEDLLKANRAETVVIVPISIQYRYLNPPWAKLDWLLSQLEADSGLPVQQIGAEAIPNSAIPDSRDRFYTRLLRLSEALLSHMEAFYRRFYHQPLPEPIAPDFNSSPQELMVRLDTLMNTALQVAEQYFGLPHEGTVIERCRRLEEASWTYMYRDDLIDRHTVSPLQQGLADWVAEEADLRVRHMRLVESFVAVTGTYIQEKPTIERFTEIALLLFDLIARIKDRDLPRRPRLGWRQALIKIGEPISVSDRWSAYDANHRAARQAVTDLTQALQVALETLMVSK